MNALKARVENGRIKLDEATDLPNGTELYVVSMEQLEDVVLLQDDGLDEQERQELLKSIDESLAEADTGNVQDLSQPLSCGFPSVAGRNPQERSSSCHFKFKTSRSK
jgi:uncharacterized membrane protein YukC